MENNYKQSNAGQSISIVALVSGVLSIIVSFIPCFNVFAVLGGILSVVFSVIGLAEAKKANASTALPKISLVLGIITLLFAIVCLFLFGFVIALFAMWD